MNPAILALAIGTIATMGRGPTTADKARSQAKVIEYMLSDTPAEDTQVWWEPCGQDNAFFFPPKGPIVLCLEMFDTPAAIFVAAHEAGHALQHRLGLPVDSDDEAEERAADELAALFLIEMGNYDAVVGGAKWFMQDANVDKAHPDHSERAEYLLCLAAGGEAAREGRTGTMDCMIAYQEKFLHWSTLIGVALAKVKAN